jgi:hypothetical protein
VTCLSVTGPDHGAGASGAPTTAVLNFQEAAFGVVTVGLVDNGGNGADIFQARQKCLTERAKIGLLAFRDKYGLGRYHVLALRRCINQASR